ncbi:MAG: ATP-binding protein [Micropruina sp.]
MTEVATETTASPCASEPDQSQATPSDHAAWLSWLLTHGGEVGRRVVETDWSDSPLGALEDWPTTLKVAASVCWGSTFPMLVLWGRDHLTLYNDASAPSLGADREPDALGKPAPAVWKETWAQVAPRVRRVLDGNGSQMAMDERMLFDRSVPEEEHFVSSAYSPILDDTATVRGVFCAFMETTSQVLAERRWNVLASLASELAPLTSVLEAGQRAVAVLQVNQGDHPLVALFDTDQPDEETRAQVALIDQGPTTGDWLTAATDVAHEAAQSCARVDRPSDPGVHAGVAALHAYPIVEADSDRPSLVLVVGHSRHRPWDLALSNYLGLCVSQLSAILTGLRQLSSERERSEGLAELDLAKSAFLANVSHELRTPLTLIAAPLHDALMNPALDDKTLRGSLQLAASNVNRLTRMVDAILDFSRMEAGRIKPALAELDVAALTRSLAASFEPAVVQAGLAYTMDVPDLPRSALLDHDMYERILLNLLANAVKYTPAGSIALTLRDRGDRFLLSVRDTGIGISAADQRRVFSRFEQLSPKPGARSSEGAGIGLAMVRELAELMDGSVRVRSRLGSGSLFTVELPYSSPSGGAPVEEGPRSVTRRDSSSFLTEMSSWQGIAEPVVAADPAPAPEPDDEHDDDGSARPRLLIVEDSPQMQRYLREVLSDQYRIEIAADGHAALEHIRRRLPAAVLSDVMMPGLDGIGLISQIREDPELATLPVLLLSARAGGQAAASGMDVGADDYITKPFSVAELRSRLAATISLAQARSSDAAWRRAVVGSLQEALLIADPDGAVTEVNDQFTALLGWSLAEGPFTPPYPWWPDPQTHPDEHARIARAHELIGQDQPMTGEFLLRHRDGGDVWATYWGTMVTTPQLGRTAIIKSIRDVTREHDSRRRRAAAVAVASEFAGATDLESVLSSAATGFGVLFDGVVTLRVMSGPQDVVFTESGVEELANLPQPVQELLTTPHPKPESAAVPVRGLLIATDVTGEAVCRTWIQFRAARTVLTDELIVGDLLAQALNLAVERLVAAQGSAERQANLERALESHRFIGQAIGILVERHRLTPAEAFGRLKTASQRRNIKLREIASRVIETGEDPDEAGGVR